MAFFEKKFFGSLILTIFILFSCSVFGEEICYDQKVFISDEPLPKTVKRIREERPGISDKEITEYLEQTLTEVTPEIARKKFKIKWIDNTLSKSFIDRYIQIWEKWAEDEYGLHQNKNFYPSLVICYMGKNVGYTLFTLDEIKHHQIIAEYTGTHHDMPTSSDYAIKADYFDEYGKKHNHYIDAKDSGNAVRFASGVFLGANFFDSFLCWISGSKFGFNDKVNKKIEALVSKYDGDLVTSNASFFNLAEELDNIDNWISWIIKKIRWLAIRYNHITLSSAGKKKFFWAEKHIAAFEQIGTRYGCEYWEIWSEQNEGEKQPCLFHKNGDVICITDDEDSYSADSEEF